MSASRYKTRKSDKRVFPVAESDQLRRVIEATNRGVENRKNVSLPDVIMFDLHGTIDWQNTGVGIPVSALVALKNLGRDVRVYTSSGTMKTGQADVDTLRPILAAYGIPVYTNEDKAFEGAISGVVVGDKPSDERRAGRRGFKFMDTKDFDIEKFVSTRPDFAVAKVLKSRKKIEDQLADQRVGCTECLKPSHRGKTVGQIGKHEGEEVNLALPLDKRVVEETRQYNHEYGGASIGDIVYEINSRGKDDVAQGLTDIYAHKNQDDIQAVVDQLVKEGRLKVVIRDDSKPTYYHVHVE